MKGEEKRREIRVFISSPVVFHREQDRSEYTGTMVDLSLGGMSIKTDVVLKEEDNLKIKFELPNEARFIFLSKVISIRDEEGVKIYGLRFIKQDLVDRMNLSEFIMQERSEQEFWLKDRVKGE